MIFSSCWEVGFDTTYDQRGLGTWGHVRIFELANLAYNYVRTTRGRSNIYICFYVYIIYKRENKIGTNKIRKEKKAAYTHKLAVLLMVIVLPEKQR